MEERVTCYECGIAMDPDEAHQFDGYHLCEHCFNSVTTTCDNCGARIWRDSAQGDAEHRLCSHCYEYSYTNCEDCGRLIHNDDAYYEEDGDYPYCYECFEKLRDCAIKSYGYKPEPIFYGSDNLFYGVELEIDKGGEDEDNAQKLLDIANRTEEQIYIKHDGSLHMGFEVVSHPMSLDYHINEMNWEEIFEKAIEMDYRSHNTSTCGLHVHVSRKAFGKNFEEQEASIARVVYFVEKNWSDLVKFSRRTREAISHYAARYAAISDTTAETYEKAKSKHMGRYVAVNTLNYETIEFRLFRGTLRYKTFVATLQLVDEICKCAINLSNNEMEEMSWSEFVSRIPEEKSELIEYLKLKRLYVNEVITESEEM